VQCHTDLGPRALLPLTEFVSLRNSYISFLHCLSFVLSHFVPSFRYPVSFLKPSSVYPLLLLRAEKNIFYLKLLKLKEKRENDIADSLSLFFVHYFQKQSIKEAQGKARNDT
jgi:hypothetical protein